jgi:hypothetical protein
MKRNLFSIGLILIAIICSSEIATADIFSGTHPKLGTINLSMNSNPDFSRSSVSQGDTGVSYYYGIRFKSLISWGTGTTFGENFHAQKGEAKISDTDNSGNICTGRLERSWVGSDLKIKISYDSWTKCPVAGESYEVSLKKQSQDTGFIVGNTGNPTEKIWLADRDFTRTNLGYLLPGDLVKVSTGYYTRHLVKASNVSGWLSFTQFLRNIKHPSWGA